MVLTNKGISILFGGYIGEGYSNDIYIADLANQKWGKPVVSGAKPLPRESFGMLFHRNSVWVIGGYATGVVLNDIYVLTTEEFVWERLDMFGTLPNARQGIAIAKFDHRLYLVGGCNPKTQDCYNDIHILDTNTMHSSLIQPFSQNVLRPLEYSTIGFMGPILYHFGGCYLMNTCTNDFLALRIDDKCPNECNQQGVCRQ